MPRTKGKKVGELEINGNMYSIRMTDHSINQCNLRNISVSKAVKTIKSVPYHKILDAQKIGVDVAAVHNGHTILFGFTGNRIYVVTVLDNDDVFVKKSTMMVEI